MSNPELPPPPPPRPRTIPRRVVLLVLMALPVLAGAVESVTVNGQRSFTITPATTFQLDGTPIDREQAIALGAGYSVQVTIDNVDATVAHGDAAEIDFRTLVRGPVTATDPLSVLGQPLVVTGETVLAGIPSGDLAMVEAGDILEVSGFLDANGSIAASRIELLANPKADWKLFGQVSGLGANQFAIGTQLVDFAGATPVGCLPALHDGQFVEIEALANPAFVAGSVLDQVTALECEDPNFDDPPAGIAIASLEGIISEVPDPMPDPATFSLLGIEVLTTAQTRYRGGTIDDLDPGVRIEVEGVYDDVAQTISAVEVRFVQTQVRFEAPVDPDDIVPGESILIMGRTATFTAQTRDEDGIASTGLNAPRQVEVRGLIDREGQIFTSRIRERGNPDPNDTRLMGPVSLIDAPALTILGVLVDTSGAQFRDDADTVIGAAEFFARVFTGTLVSAERGGYDPIGGTLDPLVVTLEENTVVTAATASANPPEVLTARGLSRGTLTALGADAIFGNGFD